MEEKILSIVIPVYNMEKFVGRCLDSCLAQDVSTDCYEIICIDDGSTDGTAAILDGYAERHGNVRVVHTENSGVVKARLRGLSLAVGKYVWLVDSDDWVLENSFRYMMDAAQNGDCDLFLFRERKVTEYCTETVSLADYPVRYEDNGYVTFDDHYTTGSGFHWFKRAIMTEHGVTFRPDVYYSDDTLFMAKFKPWVKRMALTEAPIYYYLQREDSVSHAVKAAIHSSCMYKLAEEYRALSTQQFPNYGGHNVRKKMKNATKRAMQAFVRDLCLYCRDKAVVKKLLKKAKTDGLYPFGVDWGQLRIDRRQSRKLDVLNWLFAFSSCRLVFWICYGICSGYRKKKGDDSFASVWGI